MAKQISESRRQREMRVRVWERENWHCWYCGQPVSPAPYGVPHRAVVDHQIPLSQGGPDEESNLITACNACNAQKGAKTVAEYRRYLAAIAPAGQAIGHVDAIFDLMETTPFDYMLAHFRRWLGQQQPEIVFFGERVDMSKLTRQDVSPGLPESADRMVRFGWPNGRGAVHAIDDFGRGVCSSFYEERHVYVDREINCSVCLGAIAFAERNDGRTRSGRQILAIGEGWDD